MYRTQHEPYAHQAQALARLEGRTYFALLMAMRTGKTKVTLDDFGRLVSMGEVDDFLLVAPAGVYRTWVAQIEDHFDLAMLKQSRVLLWSAKETKQKEVDEFLSARKGIRFLLVNVEALAQVERARKIVLDYCLQRRVYAVVDESTTIKNRKAERTKFLTNEVKPLTRYRRILTGLVTPRSPLDLWSQFRFLDDKILPFVSWTAFERRYAVIRPMRVGRARVNIVVNYQNVEELNAKIAPHSFRVRLEECYDLPPKIYQQREISMSDEQAKAYSDMKKRAEFKIERVIQEARAEREEARREGRNVDKKFHNIVATTVVTQVMKLHQILCGHGTSELGDLVEIPERRTQALLDVLEEHEGKAIIWCTYDYNVRKVQEALEEKYGKGSVARFWGGNVATREEEEAQFKTDPACQFMVATASAGGRGREWSVADLVVYFSNTGDLEHRSQSEERTQLVGKTRSVYYLDLVVRGTVDGKILATLRKKIDIAATITADNWREWVV